MDNEYRFRIADSYTPETIPMERLAEYIAALAQLLGEGANVHFGGLERSSVLLKARVDEPALPKVHERMRAVRDGSGPKDAHKAFDALDELLRADNASGSLTGDADSLVIPFPGRTRPEPQTFGPFLQDGFLDGQVVELNAKSDPCRVQLRDGGVLHTRLTASREMVHKLGQFIDGPDIRAHGTGNWLRLGDGAWKLQEFEIVRFELLEEKPLVEVVADLRRVKGSTWGDVPDPVRELLKDRYGAGGAN
jgi:hypothetical protein